MARSLDTCAEHNKTMCGACQAMAEFNGLCDDYEQKIATLKQRLAEACLIIERLLDRKSEDLVRNAQEFIAKEGGGV